MNPCKTCEAANAGQCYVLAERQPTVTEFTADGLWVAQIVIPDIGTRTPQHAHAFDHLTMLATGAVRVSRSDAEPREFTAPAGIPIPAGVKHLFETLTPDVTLLCIHNTSRSGRVEIVAEHHIVGVF